MIQDFISSICDELSYKYCRLKEEAIYRAIVREHGFIPSPDTMRLKGQFVRVSQGSDNYEEFRWENKPAFQIRIKFSEYRVEIEVKDL